MRGGRLLYDEYVVYDPNQGSYPSPPSLSQLTSGNDPVKMKYLLRIKFNEPTDA